MLSVTSGPEGLHNEGALDNSHGPIHSCQVVGTACTIEEAVLLEDQNGFAALGDLVCGTKTDCTTAHHDDIV